MLRGLVYSIAAAVCFGLCAVLAKLCYQSGLQVFQVLQYRWSSGALLLGLILLFRDPRLLKPSLRMLGKAAVLGSLFHAVGSSFFFTSLHYVPAATASLILYFYPVTVSLLSVFFFRLQLRRLIVLSLLLVTVGCSLVFYDAFLKALDLRGILYAMATMGIFSFCMIANQAFIRGENVMTLTFYMVLFTALPFLFIFDPLQAIHLSLKQILLSLSLGLIPTAVAYALHFRAIEQVGSAYTSIFSTFEPITTVVMAALLLGEDIARYQLAGMFMIVAGIVLPNRRALGGLFRRHFSSRQGA